MVRGKVWLKFWLSVDLLSPYTLFPGEGLYLIKIQDLYEISIFRPGGQSKDLYPRNFWPFNSMVLFNSRDEGRMLIKSWTFSFSTLKPFDQVVRGHFFRKYWKIWNFWALPYIGQGCQGSYLTQIMDLLDLSSIQQWRSESEVKFDSNPGKFWLCEPFDLVTSGVKGYMTIFLDLFDLTARQVRWHIWLKS